MPRNGNSRSLSRQPRVFRHSVKPLRDASRLALVDMDGTLADCSQREHHLRKPRKDWPAFFRGMSGDPPHESIVETTRRAARDHDIVIVTGRPQEYLEDTLDWLRRNRVPVSLVLMRRAGDRRPDYVVKQEMLAALPRERIAFVLDDRESVCDMWKREGLHCYRVQGGTCEMRLPH